MQSGNNMGGAPKSRMSAAARADKIAGRPATHRALGSMPARGCPTGGLKLAMLRG